MTSNGRETVFVGRAADVRVSPALHTLVHEPVRTTTAPLRDMAWNHLDADAHCQGKDWGSDE